MKKPAFYQQDSSLCKFGAGREAEIIVVTFVYKMSGNIWKLFLLTQAFFFGIVSALREQKQDHCCPKFLKLYSSGEALCKQRIAFGL
jgi:hypothetical protein